MIASSVVPGTQCLGEFPSPTPTGLSNAVVSLAGPDSAGVAPKRPPVGEHALNQLCGAVPPSGHLAQPNTRGG